MIKGIAASPGIQIGRVYVLEHHNIVIDEKILSDTEILGEIERLNKALDTSKFQLTQIREDVEKEMGSDKAEIFGAHLMILDDPVLIDEIQSKIKADKITAENSVMQIVANYVAMFNTMEDEYLKERAADIKDVGERIVKNILGIPTESRGTSEKAIIIAKDLTPSDTAQMDRGKVLAFATDMGGPTSHTAIMARSLEIPAVVGLVDISQQAKNGDEIIIDGNEGVVYINPQEVLLQEYERLKQEYAEHRERLKQLKDLSGKTLDGVRTVELSANIGTPKDVVSALDNGAEGVGLYRTEFLYMDRETLPSEEEQYEAYREVAEKMAPRPIIIRTLDIGGDKKLPYLDMPEELNPFLGWRALRLCLDRPHILKTQLKAILMASSYGNIKIMYPMVSGLDEIRRANVILNESKQELKKEGISFDENLEVGIMVEIPSTAVIADMLIKEVDFFSIGTNDLIQYTLAVDRMNEHISHLYEPLHPAVLRLIKNVINASHKAGKWTGMCGEMAGDVSATAILLGMGLDEFSMSASSIPMVKKIIRSITYDEAKQIAEKALSMDNPEDIRNMVASWNEGNSSGYCKNTYKKI